MMEINKFIKKWLNEWNIRIYGEVWYYFKVYQILKWYKTYKWWNYIFLWKRINRYDPSWLWMKDVKRSFNKNGIKISLKLDKKTNGYFRYTIQK